MQKEQSTPEKPLTRAQAARFLGCDVRTIDQALRAGTITFFRTGRKVHIPRKPFFTLLESGVTHGR